MRCRECDDEDEACPYCGRCDTHCNCDDDDDEALFDADELGLDPEDDEWRNHEPNC